MANPDLLRRAEGTGRHGLPCRMASPDPGRSALRRYGVVCSGLVLWLVVVITGAGSEAEDSLLGVERLDVVWVVALGLMVIIGIITLILLNPFGGEWSEPDRHRPYGVWLLLLGLIVLSMWKPDLFSGPDDDGAADDTTEETESALESIVEEAPETVAQLSDLLLIALAVAAISIVVFLLRHRDEPLELDAEADDDATALEADLEVALAELTTELAIGGDPRAAVLTAYAILESVLGNHGSKRKRSETPAEHVRRALADLRVDPGPLVELGELYERARFSQLAITEADKEHAIRSLERARAELATRS